MSKSQVLFNSLMIFYNEPNSEWLDMFTQLTSKESDISLRLLDWLVTNYSKKNNIVYILNKSDEIKINFNMFMEYKAQLKAYSKRYFDPFCRRERVSITNSIGQIQETTVAQLNFFKWALLNKVIEYAMQHKDTIELDMLSVSKHKSKGGQESDQPKKRRELSSAAIKTCTKTLCHITVRF